MLDTTRYREFLLRSIPGAKPASGGKEVNCRCFECPDSKDIKHGHFYISIPQSENKASEFYCQKCHCRGYVTHKKLIQWGIYDDAIAIDLYQHNSKLLSSGNTRKINFRETYQLYNDYINKDDLSAVKLRYINNRIGSNFSYDDLIRLKIVLNLNDVIDRNKLKPTRNINIINDLDQSFIGFISIDNAFINMRKLVQDGKVYKSIDKRYINYSLFDKFDNTERFYTIPNIINMSQNRRIQLHIAEGPFDILSIYYNLRGQSNDIYTSIAGSNYKGIIRHFISLMKLPYIEIHIYPDNDKYGSNYVMQDIKNYVSSLGCPLYIHRNVYIGQKDFGVDINHIDEKITPLI